MTIAGRQTSPTKILAIALAAAVLVGQLASFAHIVIVQHVACEHGELVEVGWRASTVSSAANRRAAAGVTATSAAASHGHDHCLLAPMRRDRLGPHAPAAGCTILRDSFCDIARGDTLFAPPPIGVLILAPKNSPPTA